MAGRHYVLSDADRVDLQWNQTISRRQRIPKYPNSLVNADMRQRKCETCRKWFSSIDDMRRHISLTHTGNKPVVCHICGKRFGTTKQRVAHYKMHKEPRLEEFSILTKRRQPDALSETSDTSRTTVGTFHRIPKTLKTYTSEPQDFNKSFGTGQSFKVSQVADTETVELREQYLKSQRTEKLPDIIGAAQSSARSKTGLNSLTDSVNIRNKKKLCIPTPDAGHITTIDNVMGISRTIETSAESHFVEEAENDFVRSRMESISRAGRPETPKSFKTRSGLTEYRKPKYLVDKEFWDTGSHLTDRVFGYSPVSGYDPYSRDVLNSRGTRRTSAFSFRSMR